MCFSSIKGFKCSRGIAALISKPYTSEEGGGSAAFNKLSMSPASICKAKDRVIKIYFLNLQDVRVLCACRLCSLWGSQPCLLFILLLSSFFISLEGRSIFN